MTAKICSILILSVMLQGCLGTIVGTTADVAIEIVKVPFKVGGAVIDVVTGDGSKKEKQPKKSSTPDDGDENE